MPTIEKFDPGTLTVDLMIANTFPASAQGAAISAWKLNPAIPLGDSAILDAIIEFSAPAAILIGNGTTERVGIYGANAGGLFLLGVAGINMGGTAPQIPIVTNLAFTTAGYAQIITNIGGFSHLAIGGVSGAIGPLAQVITVRARPILKRVYAG